MIQNLFFPIYRTYLHLSFLLFFLFRNNKINFLTNNKKKEGKLKQKMSTDIVVKQRPFYSCYKIIHTRYNTQRLLQNMREWVGFQMGYIEANRNMFLYFFYKKK